MLYKQSDARRISLLDIQDLLLKFASLVAVVVNAESDCSDNEETNELVTSVDRSR